MKRVAKLALLACLALPAFAQQAHYRYDGKVALPDGKVTPGAVRAGATAFELCSPRFTTRKYRHTSEATKLASDKEYGVVQGQGICEKGCERDHLISLELGGDDVLTNLWTQPPDEPGAPGFQSKDWLENELHRRVCSGEMSLAQAQMSIARDWYQTYLWAQRTQSQEKAHRK